MLCVATIPAFVVLVPLGSPATATADPVQCSPTMTFALGGTGHPDAEYFDLPEPHEIVDYPAAIWPLQQTSHDASVRAGVAAVNRDVRAYHAICPGSRLVIVGHSLGAEVAGDEINALDDDPGIAPAVAGVGYADPRNPAGGVEGSWAGIMPGLTMRGNRKPPVHIRFVEICHANDGICHEPNPLTDPVGAANGLVGYLAGDHGYPIEPALDVDGPDRFIPEPPRIPGYRPPAPAPVPTPNDLTRQAVDPVLDALPDPADWLPALPGPPGPYRPTPVADLVPAGYAPLLPPAIASFVPPPLPHL
jgi:hypothetical protein